jgi:hypothetical protein
MTLERALSVGNSSPNIKLATGSLIFMRLPSENLPQSVALETQNLFAALNI